jgi:glycosyltransferase involved in cell wall biosynthesis
MSKVLSVVIPCLNEADSIPEVISSIVNEFKNWPGHQASDFELLVVDDRSEDQSAALLKQFPEVTLVQNETRLGYGGALKKGFSLAQGQHIAFLDLDRTYDPKDLKALYAYLKSNQLDIVFGDRMSKKNMMPMVRHIGNALYAGLIRVLYGASLNDVCTGSRLFKRELAPKIAALPEDGLNFTIAFTSLVLLEKKRFKHIPIAYNERLGRSKLSVIRDGFSFLFTLLRYRFLTLPK